LRQIWWFKIFAVYLFQAKGKNMTTTNMKLRTEKQLTKMGYSINEAQNLINKYWNQVDYLKTAREKALYMTA
jgi:hypothetical protein